MSFAQRLAATLAELEAQGESDSPFKAMVQDLAQRMQGTDQALDALKSALED